MRWKAAQKKARLKRKVRLAALTLFLIIAVVLVGNVVRIGHTLFSPLSIQTARTYHWDSNFNLNLVLTSKPLALLSYNPVESRIRILEIPDEAYVEVPGGYGSWKIGAVKKLGDTENPPKGGALLKSSLGSFLSLPIDGVIDLKGGSSREFVDKLRGNPINSIASFSTFRTDLTPMELTRLLLGVRGVRFDKIEVFNLFELGLLSEERLADGQEVLVGDSGKIDALLTANFTDTKVLGEAATIAVLNATERPGLAAKTAQLITHIGGNVIIQGSFTEKLDQSLVSGDQKFPYTTKRLEQIFGAGCENKKDCDKLEVLDQSAPALSRASVNLILGQP